MGILCDTQIRELIGIEPFEQNVKRTGKVSYGVSSYGYDVRVGSVFKIFTNVNSEIVDPKRFYREPGNKNRLQPANAAMEPRIVDAGQCKIQGVVIGVLRSYHG